MITREEVFKAEKNAQCHTVGISYNGIYVLHTVAGSVITESNIDDVVDRLNKSEAQLANTEQLTCEWVKDARGEEYELLPVFYTKCGSSFVFSECGIKENNFLFCPYCGRKIISKDTQ